MNEMNCKILFLCQWTQWVDLTIQVYDLTKMDIWKKWTQKNQKFWLVVKGKIPSKIFVFIATRMRIFSLYSFSPFLSYHQFRSIAIKIFPLILWYLCLSFKKHLCHILSISSTLSFSDFQAIPNNLSVYSRVYSSGLILYTFFHHYSAILLEGSCEFTSGKLGTYPTQIELTSWKVWFYPRRKSV